jgi:alpha-N-arabinofuranosidase
LESKPSKTNDWDKGKGDALRFEPVDWYELLREGQRMEGLIEGHWQAMAEFDRDHHIKLMWMNGDPGTAGK